MLCSSIRRWKFQRIRIGKLLNTAWYFKRACNKASTMLAASTADRIVSVRPSSAQSCAGSTRPSESTMCAIIENSNASNAPMAAVHSVSRTM